MLSRPLLRLRIRGSDDRKILGSCAVVEFRLSDDVYQKKGGEPPTLQSDEALAGADSADSTRSVSPVP